jgi:hypothetical protein
MLDGMASLHLEAVPGGGTAAFLEVPLAPSERRS